jgi:hypothetical protein
MGTSYSKLFFELVRQASRPFGHQIFCPLMPTGRVAGASLNLHRCFDRPLNDSKNTRSATEPLKVQETVYS